MKSNAHIIICGNYGAGNLGDEMILAGMLKLFREHSPKLKITVFSSNPKETSKLYKVKSVLKFPSGIRSFIKFLFSNKKQIKALKNCDYFILGGGGLFGELTFKANIIWGIQGFMALRHKKSLIIYGQSIGKLKGKIKKFIVKKLFKKADYISLRDNVSKSRLEELGIKKEILVSPDLAFNLVSPPPLKKRKKQIIVALRQLNYLPNSFIKEISDFLSKLISEKYKILFVKFQNGEKNDENLHKKILKTIRKNSNMEYVKKIPYTKDFNKILQVFSESEFVLGMRLHSIISAMKTKTPFLGINYATKIQDLLKDFNLEKHSTDIKNIKSEELLKSFQEAKNMNFPEIERVKNVF